jgi:hypothetical protein
MGTRAYRELMRREHQTKKIDGRRDEQMSVADSVGVSGLSEGIERGGVVVSTELERRESDANLSHSANSCVQKCENMLY